MGISTDRTWRPQLIFFSILLMLGGLFFSRFLLSAATILFLIATCVHSDIGRQGRNFFHSRFLLALAFLFFIPLITWFWSDDKQIWWRFIRIKMPLLLLPFAFAGSWKLSAGQWKIIAWCFLLLVLAGGCWSLFQYLSDHQTMQQGYLKAKVIPTPFDNDHVRFSLVVAVSILCCWLLFRDSSQKQERVILIALAIFFALYLHILSARTGLIGFYLLLAWAGIYLAFTRKKPVWTVSAVAILVALPLLAWFLLPTFRNRVRYMIYDFSYLRQGQYLQGSNDGNRVLSIRAGWDLLRENPVGVGSGDVMQKTNEWYDVHVPQMLATDRLYPSSEWMMYGASAGWPGLLLFSGIMLLPFFEKNRERFAWTGLCLLLAFSMAFDIGLEAQFGVFIYAFLLLWWWKWLGGETLARERFKPSEERKA